MLNVIVFSCGAALMGLELVAARVLAPYMGNSIYVWGSVISVVMIALSLGYWLGGQLADRFGPSRVLAPVIAGSGLFTVAAPWVASAVLPSTAEWGPRIGSLAAAAFIYFVPALLLAMVSPLGVRLASSRGLEHIGRSAGGLYAISTAGSIVGTLATSFWLIPLLSLEPLVVWTGFALLATSLAALSLREPAPAEEPSSRRSSARGTASVTVAVTVAGALLGSVVLWQVAPASATNEYGETVLFRADTQYHRVTVTEDETARHLRFDHSHQSAISLDDPYESLIAYPNYMHLAMAVNPDAERVLVLGLGGGAITKRFWRDYPQVSVDSVEIDPVVVDVAERYFGLPDDPRLRTFAEDARRYVQASDDTYDVVIVDAYYADSLPFHLTTAEFLGEIKARMAPDGVIAYNVISAAEGSGSDLFRSMYRTAGGVWDRLWVFPIGYGKDARSGDPDAAAEVRRNIIVLGSDIELTDSELLERIRSRVGGTVTIDGFTEFAEDIYTEPVPVADVPVLTDSHAPTDSLIDVQ